MNFLFLGIFSEFISIFNNKNELKRAERGLIPRGSHVDVTWHSGPRDSAMRARARLCGIYVYILFI